MRLIEKCLFLSLMLSMPTVTSAYRELPFCPSGGPPGWMNYFDYRQDKNNWRNYYRNQNHQQPYSTRPKRYRSHQNSPSGFNAYPVRPMNQPWRQS